MSDDFLDMLNTETRSDDLDEFNTWFRDNIAPEKTAVTNSILDSLTDVEPFCEKPIDQQYSPPNTHLLHQQPSQDTTQFYTNYHTPQQSEPVSDPYGSPGSNFSYPSPPQSDVFLSSPQSDTSLEPDEYFVKETFFQDEAGNTFVEQEYVKKEKEVRVVPVSKHRLAPHRTIIRSVRGNPPYPKKGETTLRRVKDPRSPVPKTEARPVIMPSGYPSPPSRVVYVSNPADPAREECTTPEEILGTGPFKDERLSPSSASNVITAWEQTIKQPVTFSKIQSKGSPPQNGIKPPPGIKQQMVSPGMKQIQSPPSGGMIRSPSMKQIAATSPPGLKHSPPVMGQKRVVRVGGPGGMTKIQTVPAAQVKNEPRMMPQQQQPQQQQRAAAPVKGLNHITIMGKPGLVNLKPNEGPTNIKIYKPVNSTKPILKHNVPKVSTVPTAVKEQQPSPPQLQQPKLETEEEPEEKKTNHNAVERKYRYSINDKIMELKAMLIPKDTKIQKSGVLRKAIEHINKLQSTVDKLKYDNVQLKKKQDILEQNNRVLTMKLTEQGASVVYLEKTPDLIEPTGPYTTDGMDGEESGGKGYYTTPHSANIYQHLPDSPESLRMSDGERGHVRSNSGSSGGYTSDDSHSNKKQRYSTSTIPQSHRDQRTIPMLCMVFMFGLFLPTFLPQQAIASSSIGRTLLSVSNSNDYIFPALNCAKWGLGLVFSTTLAYLFFVVKSKVTIKDEGIIRKHFQKVQQAIKNVSALQMHV
eukprot:sb/3462378/